MEWQQFVMNLGSLALDEVERILARHGAEAVTLTDAGDDPVLEPAPGETPLWPSTRITALLPAGTDVTTLHDDLLGALEIAELPEHRVERITERAWEREWLTRFEPMRFGDRLWVCPRDSSIVEDDAVIVRLDPGLAFGTGTHPTTALCLRWLEQQDLEDKYLLDFGAGSGILSIAALRLGAAAVTAIDNDLQALTATRQNALNNGVADRLQISEDLSQTTGMFDGIVANVLAEPLIELAGELSSRVRRGGAVALSGILGTQVRDVMDAYHQWLDFDAPVAAAEWVRLTGTRI